VAEVGQQIWQGLGIPSGAHWCAGSQKSLAFNKGFLCIQPIEKGEGVQTRFPAWPLGSDGWQALYKKRGDCYTD